MEKELQEHMTVKEHGFGFHHRETSTKGQKGHRKGSYSQIKKARGLEFVYWSILGSYRIVMGIRDF